MKQRILGLIILIAIALIFVPLLFSRSGSTPSTNHPTQTVTRQVSINTPPAESTPSSANLQTTQNQVIFQNSDGTGAANPSVASSPETPTATIANANSNPEAATNAPVMNPPSYTPGTNDAAVTVDHTTGTPETATTAGESTSTKSTTTTASPPTVTATQAPSTADNVATSESNVLQAAQQQFARPANAATSATQHAATKTPPRHHIASKAHQTSAAPKKPHSAIHMVQTKTHSAAKSAANNQGWIVQLGSFSQPANVQKLVQQLHSRGFVAHVMPVHTAHGTITRVFIGPEAQRAHAERIAKQLQEQLAIHSLVVPI